MERHWLRKHMEVDVPPPHSLREGEKPIKPLTNEYLDYLQDDASVDYDEEASKENGEAIEDETKVEYWQNIYRNLQDENWILGEKKRDMHNALQVKNKTIGELNKKLEL